MRFTIILLLVSVVCLGQGKKDIKNIKSYSGPEVFASDTTSLKQTKVDSLAIPIFSTKEVMDFLIRINKKALAIKELELSGDVGYEKLVIELNKIIAEMDKKRKGK